MSLFKRSHRKPMWLDGCREGGCVGRCGRSSRGCVSHAQPRGFQSKDDRKQENDVFRFTFLKDSSGCCCIETVGGAGGAAFQRSREKSEVAAVITKDRGWWLRPG